jgi:hypothetical protein
MRLCFRLLVTIVLFNTLNLSAPAQTSVNGSLRGRAGPRATMRPFRVRIELRLGPQRQLLVEALQ